VRQPVHTVYVGAQHFRHDAAAAHGREGLEALERWGGGAEGFTGVLGLRGVPAEVLYDRVVEKLRREPVEDLRIDFEDGLGRRTDGEEDGFARGAAEEAARGMEAGSLPRGIGIRVKAMEARTRERCARTLERFLSRLLERSGGRLPEGLVVTLPKVTAVEEVAGFAALLGRLEARLGAAEGALRFEAMVEVPGAVIAADGRCPLPAWVPAAGGRLSGVHLGVYDYTAALGISALHQGLHHPACDFARHAMQVSLAGTGVWLSDGSTAALPAPEGGDPEAERAAVHAAWRRHHDDVRHSLAHGFWQGWDLHPAQLPTRFAAVFGFFLEGRAAAAAALARVRHRGGDPHAEAALLAFFRRGLDCGAFTPREVEAAGA
jgi:citrate lyase beta subunit